MLYGDRDARGVSHAEFSAQHSLGGARRSDDGPGLVLGGLMMALGWWLAGLICAITVVGLPWARSCFVIGRFSLWPFGQEAVNRRDLKGRDDLGTGSLGLIGNVLWFLVAG